MTFTGNSTDSLGDGISSNASLTVTDRLVDGNCSAYDGGGIYTGTGHLVHITGCTITGNIAGRGSAILTANICLYVKWVAKELVTITFVYNDRKIGTISGTMPIWSATMHGWGSSREGHYIMQNLTMRLQALLHLLPVTGGFVGKMGDSLPLQENNQIT